MATERETQTWWRVSVRYDLGKVEAKRVLKETGKFVTYVDEWAGGSVERREGKDTEFCRWLPSEAEAVAYARTLLTNARDRLRVQLANAEAALAAFNEAHPVPTEA
jgi:hypothetical protein